jgi:hypothetical protein
MVPLSWPNHRRAIIPRDPDDSPVAQSVKQVAVKRELGI